MTARPTEAGFTALVLAFAKLAGWRTLHLRPARTAHGWRTPVAGDGAGFPDLLLVRGDRLVIAELKIPPNRLTPEQAAWLRAFAAAGVEVFVWQPSDWPLIERVLSRPDARPIAEEATL